MVYPTHYKGLFRYEQGIKRLYRPFTLLYHLSYDDLTQRVIWVIFTDDSLNLLLCWSETSFTAEAIEVTALIYAIRDL